MSFTLMLGITNDDPIVLNKTATFPTTITISPLDTVDELNPYIIINYSSSIMGYNYAKIPEFNNRYYFVKYELLTSGRIGLTLSVDPLMSWYDRGLGGVGIKDITTTIIRTGGIVKPTYTEDSLLPIEPKRRKVNVQYFQNSPHNNNGNTGVHLLIHTI